VALSLNQWTPISTNTPNLDGSISITVPNTVSVGNSQRFYLLQLQ
jgi:hypothetical protein